MKTSIKFSIIIPVALDRKADVVESIKGINYDTKRFEVIIKTGQNPSVNRNLGIKEANGEILFFVDDDAYVDKDILNIADKFFLDNPGVGIVGGPQLTLESGGVFARISGYALASYLGAYNMRYRYKKGRLDMDISSDYLTSANFFIRKSAINKLGDFKIDLYPGEDIEFFERARRLRFRLCYNPDLVIYHKRRKNPYLFCKQIFNYGRVLPIRVRRYNQKLNPIFLLPSLFFIYLASLPILLSFNLNFLFPLIVYLLIILVYTVLVSVEYLDILALFILPFVYILLHISYGIGFIYGLVRDS